MKMKGVRPEGRHIRTVRKSSLFGTIAELFGYE